MTTNDQDFFSDPCECELQHADLVRLLKSIFAWVWGPRRHDPQAVRCRFAVLTWLLAPELFNHCSQQDLSRLLGYKSKQNVSNEVADFRRQFGYTHDIRFRHQKPYERNRKRPGA